MSKAYDYLIVGAGLFGAVFAHEATKAGRKCLVVDKRDHIAGNIYTEQVEGINVHRYGAHIFHTNNKQVWDYVNQFAVFNRYTNSPVANYHGELYNLPFNMNTFNKMWGVVTPGRSRRQNRGAARRPLYPGAEKPGRAGHQPRRHRYLRKAHQRLHRKTVGPPCDELPAFIIKRLPVRLTFDNNYFNALYQGIPNGGYTQMVANMLKGIEVRLGVNYLKNKAELDALANRVIYTGAIDAYFDYQLGALQYRSVRFETETLDCPNYQGNAVINYTDAETPYTRIIEHKHFEFGSTEPGTKTVISREYSAEWKPATNRTTRSTTSTTPSCTPATRRWPTPSRMSCSAAVWANTATTIWTRSLRAPSPVWRSSSTRSTSTSDPEAARPPSGSHDKESPCQTAIRSSAAPTSAIMPTSCGAACP